ncbi:MAG: CapA family protein, partial [Armatimonadetes bacterium]|nr:CapA family protein [Armatimonadota bacterium]
GSPPKAEPAVTLVAVGDVQLGRGVGRLIERHGPNYPFEHVRDIIQEADLAVFNLECALSENGTPIQKRFSFRADPIAADGLARAGVDIAVLANNHSVDCGRWASPETIDALESRGIACVGGGADMATAADPIVVERNGLRLAFLARTFILPDGVIYREDVPTVATYDPDRIEEEIRAARRLADVVIVSLHWGVEYARQPQESQRRIARRLIDAGADLVIGHHTHTPQPVERYKDGIIAYSLGNFVFDSHAEGGRRGIMLRCTITKAGIVEYQEIPMEIERGQPFPTPIAPTAALQNAPN